MRPAHLPKRTLPRANDPDREGAHYGDDEQGAPRASDQVPNSQESERAGEELWRDQVLPVQVEAGILLPSRNGWNEDRPHQRVVCSSAPVRAVRRRGAL